MNFTWNFIGNEKALEYLDRSLKANNLANFYIFSGPTGLGKFSLAKNFAQNIFLKEKPEWQKQENLLELNSDFIVLEKEEGKKNISVQQIRDLIIELKSSPLVSPYKIAIIKEAENLNLNSANALLKILEDPLKKTIVILTISDLELLPSTIISRSQTINFYLLKNETIYQDLIDNFALSPSLAKNISNLSAGRPSLARKFLEDQDFYQAYQEVALNFLHLIKSNNLADRFKILNNLKKEENLLGAREILGIGQTVLRDLIFLNLGQNDLLRNTFIKEDLRADYLEFNDIQKIQEKISKISSAESLYQANFNFSNVLEYLAINI